MKRLPYFTLILAAVLLVAADKKKEAAKPVDTENAKQVKRLLDENELLKQRIAEIARQQSKLAKLLKQTPQEEQLRKLKEQHQELIKLIQAALTHKDPKVRLWGIENLSRLQADARLSKEVLRLLYKMAVNPQEEPQIRRAANEVTKKNSRDILFRQHVMRLKNPEGEFAVTDKVGDYLWISVGSEHGLKPGMQLALSDPKGLVEVLHTKAHEAVIRHVRSDKNLQLLEKGDEATFQLQPQHGQEVKKPRRLAPVPRADRYHVQPNGKLTIKQGTTAGTGMRIYQSIPLSKDPIGGNISLRKGYFLGARFKITSPVRTAKIGGYLASYPLKGRLLAAIVALSGPEDVPDSTDLTTPDVLAFAHLPSNPPTSATQLSLKPQSAVVDAPIHVELSPGWYALVYGSGRFGATGEGYIPNGGTTQFTPLFTRTISRPSRTTAGRFEMHKTATWETFRPSPFHFFLDAEGEPAGVLANDVPLDGKVLSAELVKDTQHGKLKFNKDGTFNYTPKSGFRGKDMFTYAAINKLGLRSEATVLLSVGAVGEGYRAVKDSYNTNEGDSLLINSPGVLANDEGDRLRAQLITGPVHGTLKLKHDGSFTYMPKDNFAGQDMFIYRADSLFGPTAPAKVSIKVIDKNDPPVAVADQYQVRAGRKLTAGYGEILARQIWRNDNNSIKKGSIFQANLLPVKVFTPDRLVHTFAVDPQSNRLYFACREGIYSSQLDGSKMEKAFEIPKVPANPVGRALPPPVLALAIDSLGGKIYWATGYVGMISGKISRANLDGTKTEDLVSSRLKIVRSLALDLAGKKMYWIDAPTKGIQRANLDGSGVETIFRGAARLSQVALDHRGKIYWVSSVYNTRYYTPLIQRANLDGSKIENVIAGEKYSPTRMALDAARGHLYFTDRTTNTLNRANLDGTGIEVLHRNLSIHRTYSDIVLEQVYATGNRFSLLANDQDADGNSLKSVLVEGPSHGTLKLNSDGSFVYQSKHGFHGIDTFTYKATDGSSESTAKVSIKVTPPEGEAPVTKQRARISKELEVKQRTFKPIEKEAIAFFEKLGGKVTIDEKSPGKSVIGLNLDKTNITDAGLVHLKDLAKLQSLELNDTEITDAGLVHLNDLTELQKLGLYGTKITDTGLMHLNEFSNLQELNLDKTKVTDAGMARLNRLTNLHSLSLFGTNITDVGLNHLKLLYKLRRLNLIKTNVTYDGIKKLNSVLRKCQIFGSVTPEDAARIRDENEAAYSYFRKIGGSSTIEKNDPSKTIVALHFTRSDVTDAQLVKLKGLTKLQKLYLRSNNITDVGLSHLKGLTNLQDLEIHDSKITDAGLVHLKGLTNLRRLFLKKTPVKDLSPLKGLTNLRELWLLKSQVKDLSPLKGLTNLYDLRLPASHVKDLSPLKGLTNLKVLDLGSLGFEFSRPTSVTDLSPLKDLKNLEFLRLKDTNVADLSSLESLKDLKRLDLNGTNVKDLSPLKGLTRLNWLGLKDTPVSVEEIQKLQKALPRCKIEWDGRRPALRIFRGHEKAAITYFKKLGGGFKVYPPGGPITLLYLDRTNLTNDGLLYLKEFSSLNVLSLQDTEITDAGLVHLKGLTKLQFLAIRSREVTDAGLEHLKGLTSLRDLNLNGTSVSDAGLVYLKGLVELQKLKLNGTKVTGIGLVHLKDLDNLRDLELVGTNVTDAGLVHLEGLTNLQMLTLRGPQVTGAVMVHLKGLTNLQMLRLDFSKVTDAEHEHLKGLIKLQELNLRNSKVTDHGLVHLKGLSSLQNLSLMSTKITDAGLEHLIGLTGLRELNLSGTKITDAGLVHLKKFTGLQELDLQGTQVTNAGLVLLKGLTQLQSLQLGPEITDAGLVHMKGFKKLHHLGLVDCSQVTDAGLVHLKGVTKLQELNLMGSQITDAGLAHLKGITGLRKLWLFGTDVSDDGLVHLKGLTNLQRLNILQTDVTKAGYEKLKKALPKCMIVWTQ